GLLRMGDIVAGRKAVQVCDGQSLRPVYDWAKFADRETVWIRTRRGLELEGSVTHRVRLADGTWRRLGELREGDRVEIGGGTGQWAQGYAKIDWQPPRRLTLSDVACQVGVDIETVIRYRKGTRGRYSEALAPLVAEYDTSLATLPRMQNKHKE